MSDDNNDFINDLVDGYEPEEFGGDSYDPTDEGPQPIRTDSSDALDQTDLVLKVLAGQEVTDEEIANAPRGRDSVSRAVDGNGKPDWTDGGARDVSEPEPQQRGLGPQQQTQYVADDQLQSTFKEAESQQQQILQAKAYVERLHAQGDITDQEAHNQLTHLGTVYGNMEGAKRNAELQYFRNKEIMAAGHAEMERLLGRDVWGSPEAQGKSMESVLRYIQKNNLDAEMFANMQDPRAASAVVKAALDSEKLARLEAENRAQKIVLKDLKRGQQRKQQKQTRDSGLGQRNRDTTDEVASLLMKHGITGRTR